MKEELKHYGVDIENIKESEDLFDNIYEAIRNLQEYTLTNRFEVILNNNLIEVKDKYSKYKMIFGCRISYDNLDKNISFIVKEETKPTYEELEERIKKVREMLDKPYYFNLRIGALRDIQEILKGEQDENNSTSK